MFRNIITTLLSFITLIGYAQQAESRERNTDSQIKCHIEGSLETDAWGDDIIICEDGTDLRAADNSRFHVKAKDGHFTYDIETDFPRLYQVCFAKQLKTGKFYVGNFLTENCNVSITMYEDKPIHIVSNGEEGLRHIVKDSIEKVRFMNALEEIDNKLRAPDHMTEFYNAEFLSTVAKIRSMDVDSLPKAYVDSIRQVIDYYMRNESEQFNTQGLLLKQRRDSITAELSQFRIAYAEKHPMLWTLYDVLFATQYLKYADNHPIHEQIATAETALRLQPGKPYIDYTVRNIDGQLVPISTLTKGKVALIDLWASWCGPCRRHSIAMIPIFERYKDKGFTVIAIARERSRTAMENAANMDGYPWQSLLELNDENGVWRKNGVANAGGAMYLIDRDGTILSTSTNAKELEPLIKKALNAE